VQSLHAIQLLGQVAGHNLGQARLDPTAQNDQAPGRLCFPRQVSYVIISRPGQIDQGDAGQQRRPNPERANRLGEGGHHHVKFGDEVSRDPLVAMQVEPDDAQFAAGVCTDELFEARFQNVVDPGRTAPPGPPRGLPPR
jgi:hypothetical protein